mmetsp:Transcript_23636/g.55994  ORF Transcript_23636/g.55994 Transcript_23636/m.55994 type:complete len:229 (+) Transcript_23636:105-791(+)
MIVNEAERKGNMVENEDLDNRSCLTEHKDCRVVHILNQMKPILKSMEQGGAFLNIVLEAFQGDELLLLEKIKPALPTKWMKAPDQELMLNYNWHCPDATDRVLDFKNNKISLGLLHQDTFACTRRQRNSCRKVTSIQSSDLTVSKGSLSYIIQGDGCLCCNGNKRIVFILLFHPQKMQFKLLVQETITAFCTSSDNIEEPYDGYDYVAYIRKHNTQIQSETDIDTNIT